MDAPDHDLTRQVPFTLERADSDGLTLTGYAAVFNDTTRIDSWEGLFDERIKRGAFSKTLSERTPVLQFDHGQHPLVGSIPIGSILDLRENQRGLRVEARLHDNWIVEPVRDAIQSGAIPGMSIRFNVIKDEWDESGDMPLRTIKEVRLHELGPVVFPAYESTTVGVRSVDVMKSWRAALDRAIDTSEGAAAGTPDEAVNHDEPHEHSSITNAQRAALAVAHKRLEKLA